MLEDKEVPPVDVAAQFVGKQVRWTGYVSRLDVYPEESEARRYRVRMVWDPEQFDESLYFFQSDAQASNVRKLRRDTRFTVTGVLGGLTSLDDAEIVSVEEEE